MCIRDRVYPLRDDVTGDRRETVINTAAHQTDGDNGQTAGATLIDSTPWRPDGRASDKMGASEHPDFVMGGQLTDDQRNDLMELLVDFNDVFDSAVPGLTNLTMHTIQLND